MKKKTYLKLFALLSLTSFFVGMILAALDTFKLGWGNMDYLAVGTICLVHCWINFAIITSVRKILFAPAKQSEANEQ